MVKQSTVCGVIDLKSASDQALDRLLVQFGRNGSLSDSQAAEEARVRAEISARKASGVSINDKGFHFPV